MDRIPLRISRLGPWREDRERGLFEALSRAGIDCEGPTGPERGRSAIAGTTLLLFDPTAPDLLAAIRREAAATSRLLALSASRQRLENRDGWRLLAAGASDVLFLEAPAQTAAAVAARLARWREIDRILDSPLVAANLVGQSRVWRAALAQVVEAARFGDSSVLLGGESGTGKELVARLIHTLDPRPDKGELIILDCTTVHRELSGSEFFGHERGAFTNAVAARDGAFVMADGGTLFLDEVGELPLPLQAELLRVIQEGTFKRIGGNQWQRTRFRLICATHRDLLCEVEAGTFRRDLYYRLAACICRLPRLAERRQDIPQLVRHFLAERWGPEAPELDPAVLEFLTRGEYPGNVRDLRQLVGRIALRHVGPGPITQGDVSEDERPGTEDPEGDCPDAAPDPEPAFDEAIRLALARRSSLKEITNQVGDAAVRLAIEAADGNVHRAAERLGVTDRALQLRRAARKKEAC